jgi:ribonuclease P protein component
MHRRGDFETAVRQGRRGAARRLVVHLAGRPGPDVPPRPAAVGFVVSRAVGGAIERNRVKRRLRALMAAHLAELPDGALVVVRALPAAAGSRSAELGGDLSDALRAAARPRRGAA